MKAFTYTRLEDGTLSKKVEMKFPADGTKDYSTLGSLQMQL